METALASATGISGGAAASIPGAFFNAHWGNQLSRAERDDQQQPDEKVEGIDCYVFARTLRGITSTVWIGKEDYLIHQVGTLTSGAALTAMLKDAAKSNPALLVHWPPVNGDITATETHTNIVLNPKLVASDFSQ